MLLTRGLCRGDKQCTPARSFQKRGTTHITTALLEKIPSKTILSNRLTASLRPGDESSVSGGSATGASPLTIGSPSDSALFGQTMSTVPFLGRSVGARSDVVSRCADWENGYCRRKNTQSNLTPFTLKRSLCRFPTFPAQSQRLVWLLDSATECWQTRVRTSQIAEPSPHLRCAAPASMNASIREDASAGRGTSDSDPACFMVSSRNCRNSSTSRLNCHTSSVPSHPSRLFASRVETNCESRRPSAGGSPLRPYGITKELVASAQKPVPATAPTSRIPMHRRPVHETTRKFSETRRSARKRQSSKPGLVNTTGP